MSIAANLPKLSYDESGKLVKLNSKQREELTIYYYANNISQRCLADKIGMSAANLNALVNNPKWVRKAREYLKKEMDKADIRKTLAKLRAIEAAPEAMNQVIRIAMQDVSNTPIQYQYAIQNAAHDILDRAGIKDSSDADSKEVRITFGDFDFDPKMPVLDEGQPIIDVTDSVPDEEIGEGGNVG